MVRAVVSISRGLRRRVGLADKSLLFLAKQSHCIFRVCYRVVNRLQHEDKGEHSLRSCVYYRVLLLWSLPFCLSHSAWSQPTSAFRLYCTQKSFRRFNKCRQRKVGVVVEIGDGVGGCSAGLLLFGSSLGR